METFDVIVVGGGPAGATLSTLVAMTGHQVLLLEREQFPRYQIGESLLPATVSGICRLLGIEDQVKRTGFVEKRGATFAWGKHPDTLWTLNFGRTPPDQLHLDPGAPYAYNVPRTAFDLILLDNAKSKGVDVRERHRVRTPILDDGTIKGVEYVDHTGRQAKAYARYVVDASGHGGCLAPAIGEREFSKFFRKIAVFGYYENGRRLASPSEGNVLFETYQDAWLWYIPLDDHLTSVGVVLPADDAERVKHNPQQALEFYISNCPNIRSFLNEATGSQQSPFHGIRTRSEFSYCHTRFWMPGGILIGDAACFVDVLLSSGVHLATYAALLAARSINSILDQNADATLCLNEFEARLRQEYAIFYQGLVGLYDMDQDSETYTHWLRSLLQHSNGVFIEWQEQQKAACPTGLISEDADHPVHALRAYNTQQIRYDGAPGIYIETPLPPLSTPLTPSPNQLYWVNASR
jgi:halogenation protein CepH